MTHVPALAAIKGGFHGPVADVIAVPFFAFVIIVIVVKWLRKM